MKTPLRYPGGKSRAIKKLFSIMPDLSSYDEWREPFLGGGSMSIAVTKTYPELSVWVNDLYTPLFNFWVALQKDSESLSTEILELKLTRDARELFEEAKGRSSEPAYFYILNKCSFSGLTESSSFSQQASVSNFSENNINSLRSYGPIIKNWKITNLSYDQLLSNDNVFVYLDPPYEIDSSLYGKRGSMHKTFDHDIFAKTCTQYTCDQLVSYNDSSMIKDRFTNYKPETFPLTYTMRSTGSYQKDQKKRNELTLINYG